MAWKLHNIMEKENQDVRNVDVQNSTKSMAIKENKEKY